MTTVLQEVLSNMVSLNVVNLDDTMIMEIMATSFNRGEYSLFKNCKHHYISQGNMLELNELTRVDVVCALPANFYSEEIIESTLGHVFNSEGKGSNMSKGGSIKRVYDSYPNCYLSRKGDMLTYSGENLTDVRRIMDGVDGNIWKVKVDGTEYKVAFLSILEHEYEDHFHDKVEQSTYTMITYRNVVDARRNSNEECHKGDLSYGTLGDALLKDVDESSWDSIKDFVNTTAVLRVLRFLKEDLKHLNNNSIPVRLELGGYNSLRLMNNARMSNFMQDGDYKNALHMALWIKTADMDMGAVYNTEDPWNEKQVYIKFSQFHKAVIEGNPEAEEALKESRIDWVDNIVQEYLLDNIVSCTLELTSDSDQILKITREKDGEIIEDSFNVLVF